MQQQMKEHQVQQNKLIECKSPDDLSYFINKNNLNHTQTIPRKPPKPQKKIKVKNIT